MGRRIGDVFRRDATNRERSAPLLARSVLITHLAPTGKVPVYLQLVWGRTRSLLANAPPERGQASEDGAAFSWWGRDSPAVPKAEVGWWDVF